MALFDLPGSVCLLITCTPAAIKPSIPDNSANYYPNNINLFITNKTGVKNEK